MLQGNHVSAKSAAESTGHEYEMSEPEQPPTRNYLEIMRDAPTCTCLNISVLQQPIEENCIKCDLRRRLGMEEEMNARHREKFIEVMGYVQKLNPYAFDQALTKDDLILSWYAKWEKLYHAVDAWLTPGWQYVETSSDESSS